MSEWIEWNEEGLPVAEGTFVRVRLRGGWTDEHFVRAQAATAGWWHGGDADSSNWYDTAGESKIVAYRIEKDDEDA